MRLPALALLLGGTAALPTAARADDETPVLDESLLPSGDFDPAKFGATNCRAVNAPISTTFFVDGCTSPTGLCTQGTISSGALQGTTSFVDLTLQPSDSGTSLLYTGQLTVTTDSGTVTINDYGIVDETTGNFFELDRVVGGTGAFDGAVGLLTSQGVMTGTGFDGTITGLVCKGSLSN